MPTVSQCPRHIRSVSRRSRRQPLIAEHPTSSSPSDVIVATRLGARDLAIELPATEPNPFGVDVHHLTIPQYWLAGADVGARTSSCEWRATPSRPSGVHQRVYATRDQPRRDLF